jgi:branched-chain amino acid transport system ATP-binding protein
MLEVRGLAVHFGGLKAVGSLDFDVPTGTIKGLIGPNGAGKTTVFNAVAGLVPLAGGEVRLQGQRIDKLPAYARVRMGMARTFQNPQIFRELTLLENVMLGAQARRVSRFWRDLVSPVAPAHEADDEAQALALLGQVGLGDRALNLAAGLSFGEAKLLEIARALLTQPRLLMLDEPMAGVPHAEQQRFIDVIRGLKARGTTVLLVEHNMRVVMNLCDEILVLASGNRLAEGLPREVARDPQVVAAYLGQSMEHTTHA